ncbi:hypothetical protein LYSHEL_01750 [Lysobacter helvus]|uniref:pEK499-p136 HEPN domain-containing protein n=2 Tax=Lysobacteraceae TaxID=32033 RepID=A0ABM7Q1Q6_9GAMM|nr:MULTISPECIES: HEPN family nuclease [Lysobacter]BCT91151.1 hypothetical protein LYSCAS_01750 [Lysobacter caseinilyticus]BCT94304.1 hypothetical protein LYSHEL_01750 [Lysobacter helvus]
MQYASRNEALGFAARTRRNLECIDAAYEAGDAVHPTTQLVVSLLGLVVVPHERNLVKQLGVMSLASLQAGGWPQWTFELQICETLAQLFRHLRNAIAHGRFSFNSDSTDISDVVISVEDYRPGQDAPYWRATISAVDLKDFCLRFIDLVEQTLG